MKNVKWLFVVCACILTPAVVQADDGGWLDWLYSMDKTLLGGAAEIHALCLGDDGKRLPGCETWWWNLRHPKRIKHPVEFSEVKHEVDVLGAGYHTFVTGTGAQPGSMWAIKLGGTYYYHVTRRHWLGLELGGGGSVIRFSGDSVHPVGAATH